MMKTPYFVIDEQILDNYYRMLSESLEKEWGNYIIGYSFKTNSLPWLIRYFKQKGAWAEVVSDDEYKLAHYLGFADDSVIYNGPYKEMDSFSSVVLAGGFVNLDSFREIEWLRKISETHLERSLKVGIRINFNLESFCPGETTMGEESGRFGFCYENGKFDEAVKMLREIPNVQIVGLHLHSSTKSRSVKVFESIAHMACKVKEEYNLNLQYVDLGGGYCGGLKGRPEYPDYFPSVCKILSDSFSPEDTKIVVEPGVSMISKCTSFVTGVFDVRDIRNSRYIMTDGSRFNIDATMIKSSYIYHVNPGKTNYELRKTMPVQTVSGFSCMECDRLFTMENMKEILPGDEIVYENVGGYTMSLNPLFIQYFPPVYIIRDNKYILVRRKWTPGDYSQGDIPE